jgi:hypothetical protein
MTIPFQLMRRTTLAAALAGMLTVGAAPAAPVMAQSGNGTTTAAVLQLPGGGRAAGFGGAYTAASEGDVVFYNPAGAAWLRAWAGLAYQRHAEQISFATAAGALSFGPGVIVASVGMLDFGSIDEIVPDPAFGGQRGMETGNRIGAHDVVARVAVAAPLPGGRLAAGASVGLLWSILAESGRTATVFDAGLQYRAGGGVTLGAALRNAGGPLEGATLVPADLPTEVRGGLAYEVPSSLTGPFTATAHLDLIGPLNDGATTFAIGAEAGILRTGPASGGVTATLRAGFNGAAGSDGVGRVHVGAGLALGTLAVDYTLQNMGVLGLTHRVGVRWSQPGR